MTEFVREHRFDLRGGELLNQRVKKHNPFVTPKSCKVRIAMTRTARTIHHEHAIGCKATARKQGFQTGFELTIGQWGEFIKQWCDERRIQPHHQNIKAQKQSPSPEPPRLRKGLDKCQYRIEQRHANDEREQGAFKQIHQPRFNGHAIETKGLFDIKLIDKCHGQIKQ